MGVWNHLINCRRVGSLQSKIPNDVDKSDTSVILLPRFSLPSDRVKTVPASTDSAQSQRLQTRPNAQSPINHDIRPRNIRSSTKIEHCRSNLIRIRRPTDRNNLLNHLLHVMHAFFGPAMQQT